MHDTASVQQHWAFVKPHRVSNRGGRRHQNEDWTEQRAEKRWMVIQLILVTKVTPVLTAELVDISIQEKEAEKPGSERRFCRRLLQRRGSSPFLTIQRSHSSKHSSAIATTACRSTLGSGFADSQEKESHIQLYFVIEAIYLWGRAEDMSWCQNLRVRAKGLGPRPCGNDP